MAELAALGAAASCLQIIQLAAEVTVQAVRFIRDGKSALPENDDIAKWSKQSQTLAQGALPTNIVSPLSAVESRLKSAKDVCCEKVAALLDILKTLEAPPNSHLRKVEKVVKTRWHRDDIEKAKNDVRDAQGQLSIALLNVIR